MLHSQSTTLSTLLLRYYQQQPSNEKIAGFFWYESGLSAEVQNRIGEFSKAIHCGLKLRLEIWNLIN